MGSVSTSPAPVQRGAQVTEFCWGCNSPVITDGDVQPVRCPNCARRAREQAVHEAWSVIRALKMGEAPFVGLDDRERLQLLSEMIGDDGEIPPGGLPILRQLDNESLIKLAGDAADELARRCGSVDPAPVARAEIEREAEQDWHADMHGPAVESSA